MKLKNKVALITGSSRGIGKATALLFAKEGAKIIINYNNSKSEAESVVEQVKKIGSDAIAIKCDVANEMEVSEMVSQGMKKFGQIDILVNNAGIVIDKPFKERTVQDWKRTLEVNLIGAFICAKEVAKVMKEGNIVNVSSINGLEAYSFPTSIDYDSSKAGMFLLTVNLAQELGPKIRVNCVAPGWVKTDINKELTADYVEAEKKRAILNKFAEPEEIAAPILFLVSDEASFITGSILKVDGGYR